jgi:hypothetical protein
VNVISIYKALREITFGGHLIFKTLRKEEKSYTFVLKSKRDDIPISWAYL